MRVPKLYATAARLGMFPPRRIKAGVAEGLRMSMRNASGDYAEGTNELWVQEAVRGVLCRGDVFYDVGANIGFYSVLAGRVVGSGGQVYAFEPVAGNARCIRRNAARNGFTHVSVHEAAVAARDGTATLFLSSHPGGASIASPEDGVLRTVEISTMGVDAAVQDGRLRPPNVVKIDVEGAEAAVLDGMARTITDHGPVIILELDHEANHGLQERVAWAQEVFRKHGYVVDELPASYAAAHWNVAHLLAAPVGSNRIGR